MSTADFTSAAIGPVSTRARGAQPRLRITRRGRVVLTSLVALPIAVVAMIGVINGGGASATSGDSAVRLEQFTVQPGQSLWQLAEEYAPNADPRDFIAEVESLNGITATVEPGQVLDLPAIYSE